MQRRSTRRARGALMAAVATIATIGAAPAVAGAGTTDTGFDTIVDGLGNPRGLGFSANGRLYVAEGGDGGSVCFEGEGCVGLTARISRVDVAARTRADVVTGLLSLGDESGFFSVGASGLAVQGNQVFAVMAGSPVGAPPAETCIGRPDEAACRAVLAAAANLGGVLRLTPGGPTAWRQNVGRFNYEWTAANNGTVPLPGWKSCDQVPPGEPCNPDFQPGDANPYAAVAAPGGIYVVDGGANTLTWVPSNPGAAPTVLAALPNSGVEDPYDAVPTCVATVGSKVVIGDLSGRLFVYDGSTMYPSPVTTTGPGFLGTVGGCAGDGKGNVYVSDLFLGTVQRLSVKDLTLTPVATGLPSPTGVAVAKDGSVYAAVNGVCPSYLTGPAEDFCSGSGAVVRLHGR